MALSTTSRHAKDGDPDGGGLDFEGWIGKTRTLHEIIGDKPVSRLAKILNINRPDCPVGKELATVPDGWHFLCFLPNVPASRIGPDGHPLRGDFIPPIPFPRRMFGGAETVFHRPLRTGAVAELTETILGVDLKTGRSGAMWILRIGRTVTQDRHKVLDEVQTILYRQDAPLSSTEAKLNPDRPASLRAEWCKSYNPSPVDLFRFSAVTFNSHRIHYDRDYATGVENYPGLVIHGPLTAVLLLEAARDRKPGHRLAKFSYRPLAPLFDISGLNACGRWEGETAHLWAETPDGRQAMTATGEFERI